MEVSKGNEVTMRDYRKGNWSLDETLILIEAKKLDEQRRMTKGTSSNANSTTMKPSGGAGELRWKWVEEYCWKKGCLRSQNQCNDKWDNLMRDFKKVKAFERRRCTKESSNDNNNKSYWNMDKTERKQHNLPSNMLPQIYEALAQVVEVKLGISPHSTMAFHPPPPPQGGSQSQPLPMEEASAKRSSEEGESGRSISEKISASARALAETIKGYDEREERRHRELYTLHQKRFKSQESKIELERQGFDGLVHAINNLSNSIIAFTSQKTPP